MKTILLFTTPSCEPCKAMKPAFIALMEEQGIKYEIIDAWENTSAARKYKVMGVPTIIVQAEAERCLMKLRKTAWFIRLKKDLLHDEIIREDTENSFYAAEARVDRMATVKKAKLKDVVLDTVTAFGETIKEVTSTGEYIRTGIISQVDSEGVQIFWGLDGFSSYDPDILGNLVKSGSHTHTLTRND